MAKRRVELLLVLVVVLLSTASGLLSSERRLDGLMTADSIDKLVVTGDPGASASFTDGAATSSAATSKAADLQPAAKPPIAHTYRNAYGTHFNCSSTWTLLLGMYVVFVVGGFLLLSVIPVRFATNEKMEAPFMLWFGSPKKITKDKRVEEHEGAAETASLWCRAASWLAQTTSSFFVAPPTHNVDIRYRFHADMTQQLAASAATAKTYESIAVATDDLEVKPPPSPETFESVAVEKDDLEVAAPPSPQIYESVAVSTDNLEVKAALPPQPDDGADRATGDTEVESHLSRRLPRPSSRSSIFMGAPPSSSSMARKRQGSTRFTSDSSTAKAASIGRRTLRANSRGGRVETKEDFVRAATRRQSMAARAERRVALVEEDVSYENLGDEEICMYEYLEFIRELLDGLVIKKVCQKSGRVVSRTLRITPDMTTVFWNSVATLKRVTAKSSILAVHIEEVLKGLHGSANVTARYSPERDALCVSIRCTDGKWLVLEAKTEAMRQRLFLGFTRLAQERHDQDAGPAELAESTFLEAKEEEEEFDVREQQQLQAESIVQVASSREVETSIEREEILAPLREEQESELMAEQPGYEEKTPPPLEEELLQRELLFIRATYGYEASDDQDEVADRGGEAHQNLGDQARERLPPAVYDPLEDNEETKQDRPPPHQKEEKEADQPGKKRDNSNDDGDIDNLSDDPEMSRE